MKYQGTKLANFTPRKTVAELEASDSEIGTGEEVRLGATITAHYTGALAKKTALFFKAALILASR